MCSHPEFRAVVEVSRLENAIAGDVEGTGYIALVRVTCVACGLPFRFVGLAAGFDCTRPTLSTDGEELRAPIEPAVGQRLAEQATYRVPARVTTH
jgi:hypothetical protein